MVDPEKITDYNLTKDELEERILFWVAAAGKNGRTAALNVDKLLRYIEGLLGKKGSPFSLIREVAESYDLPALMKSCGFGCYNIKAKSFIQLANSNMDLSVCSAEDLESMHGIGMKTSRCFILHSRHNAMYAGLDTHILKYLSSMGVEDVPKATPNSKRKYLRLEASFLQLAGASGRVPAELDLEIWNSYSKKIKD